MTNLDPIDAPLRFAFGENWNRFLDDLGQAQVEAATDALRAMVGDDIPGRVFLDVGCGSGLSSLAALRLGAERVVAFDVDTDSVVAARRLRDTAGIDPDRWEIHHGSALDASFVEALGPADVVYSWGVLHHTGDQWRALDVVAGRVPDDGVLFIALYNDQGWRSQLWRQVKRRYNRSGLTTRRLLVAVIMAAFESRFVLRSLATGTNPFRRYRGSDARGMTVYRDWVDWVGGYPFEVSKPEELLAWGQELGLRLVDLRTCGGGMGCNEFVFRRDLVSVTRARH